MEQISKEQYELIINKLKSIPEIALIDLLVCFDSVIHRKPSNEELEIILIYLNRKDIPQA